MKELRKRLLALGMGAVMIFAMGAVGCDNGHKEQTPSTGTTTPDPDKDKDNDKGKDEPSVTPDPDKDKEPDVQNPDKEPDKEPDDKPVTPPVTEKKTLEEAKTEFDAFVQKLTTGKNFTYELEKPLQNITAEFAGDKLKTTRHEALGDVVTYYSTESGENFVYALENDKAWHKDFAEEGRTIDYALSTVTDALDDVTWTAYDADANLLSGEVDTTIEGTPVKAEIEANFDQNDMSVKMKSGLTTTNMQVSKIGTTSVTLPENVIDETAKNENIFTVENGETIWNVKAIKEVLEPWLKNEGEGNQYGKDMFAATSSSDAYKTKEVVYINSTKDNISFGVILDVDGQLRFGEAYFYDSAFYESLTNKDSMTSKEFKEYLMQLNQRRLATSIKYFDVEYTTHDEDYETAHKLEFETLTKNVFKKYHKEKAAEDPDYNGAEVLFAFKTPMGPTNLGYDGYGRAWDQYYFLRQNEKVSLIKADGVRGLIDGDGPLQNVLQNKDEQWKIGYGIKKLVDISKENESLFQKPIMAIGKDANLSKE